MLKVRHSCMHTFTCTKQLCEVALIDKGGLSLYLNPLTHKTDWHLTSPYNISPETHIKVKRIKEMITR